MTPERWAQIKEICGTALEKPELERAEWLDSACGGDDVLRADVERLLAQDDESLASPVGLLAQAAPALAAGEMLSQYHVEAKLGQGGMGAVYRAYDTRLRRPVALKVLSPEHLADPDSKQRLMREARAASALNHPNIVGIYEVGSDNGVDYIAMEFVEGKTLQELIPDKGLPIPKVLDCAAQIAAGLAKAHSSGVIHRDLKPGNVMVTSDGLVKLLDFGLARRVRLEPGQETTLTVEGEIAGTPAYMSPEQAEGKPLDPRSDVFSFGLVLYQMLTGRQAFSGDSTASVLAAVLREEPPPFGTNIPRDLERIVRRCLRKDPTRRFQHIDDVRVELEELKAESPLVPAEPLARSRWPSVTVLGAGLTAGMLAGMVVSAWLLAGPVIDLTKHRYSPIVTSPYVRSIGEGGGMGAFLPAWSPDGKSIVYSADGVRLQRVDGFESKRLTAEGVSPFFSRDGSKVYYLSATRTAEPGRASRDLWSISVAGGAPQRVLSDLGAHPLTDGAGISQDGNSIVIVRRVKAGDNEMSVWVSSPPGAEPRPYPGSPSGRRLGRAYFRFSPDGSKLLLILEQGRDPVEWWLLKWPPPTAIQPNAMRRLFKNGPQGMYGTSADWLPDSRHVIAAIHDDGEGAGPLWVADTVTEAWHRITLAPFAGTAPRVSREGRVLFDLVKVDEHAIEVPLDRSPIRPLPASGLRREQYPSWSPVARQVLFVTDQRGEPEIWLASPWEGWQRPVVTQRDFPQDQARRWFITPAFSPDGTSIAYTSRMEIWVSPVAGGPPVRICDGSGATWSPDGASLAVAVSRGRNVSALMSVPLGRPQDAVVIRNTSGQWLPLWSPDGRWITIQLPGGFGVVSPDGSQEKILYRGALDWGAASGWSHDGSTLFIAYLTPQGRVLSAFDIATGRERRLRDLGSLHFSYYAAYGSGLSLSPDRKSLLGSTANPHFEPWILDGLQPPRSFLARLFSH
jgi:serine/threonine protein kinase